MEELLEESLLIAVRAEDHGTVSRLLSQGANPIIMSSDGRTSLGEAAQIGNDKILKLLIDACKTSNTMKTSISKIPRKRHKRKLRNVNNETVVKCKNLSDRTIKEHCVGQGNTANVQGNVKEERNQGYFVFIHSEGSSSDESKISSLISPISPTTVTPSPQELEWDEDIVNVAPTTTEDETWCSIYKWYAAVLECTGEAIASASLIASGIDQHDGFMRTALHYASEHGHKGAVKLLIDAGSKVDVTASEGITALHMAVVKNHPEIVKMLVAAGGNVDCKTHEKMTPLHFAATRGYLEQVKILVNNGACLEARDIRERTALYLATWRGHVDVVRYLISSGANVNGEQIHGYTPICEAVWGRHAEIVEILLSSGARITHSHRLLHNAVIQSQEEIVKMLANFSGGINLHNDTGDTPLLLAVRLSRPSIARILLEKGANVNACNNITGANALHIAVESIDWQKELEETLACLLEYRIDTNATALTGDTALNRALLLQRDYAAILLIRYGSDVNACDIHTCGLDNLTIASRRQTPDLASMLIKAGHCTTIPDPTAIIPNQGSTSRWLYHASKNPLSLSDIIRIKIRHMCTNKTLSSYIKSLPLPKSLKRFLMMEDEGF